MYFLLLVFLAVTMNYSVNCFTEEQLAMKKALRDSCVEESGVDVAILEAVDKGALLTPDPKLKCYLKCTFESSGCYNDGLVDMSPIFEMMPDAMRKAIEPVVTKCGTIKGEDECDTLYKTNKCYQDSNPEVYFL